MQLYGNRPLVLVFYHFFKGKIEHKRYTVVKLSMLMKHSWELLSPHKQSFEPPQGERALLRPLMYYDVRVIRQQQCL